MLREIAVTYALEEISAVVFNNVLNVVHFKVLFDSCISINIIDWSID